MMRRTLALSLVVLAAAGCARPALVDTAVAPAMTAAPPPATADHLPAGTVMQVRLTQPLGTAHSEPGDRFTATVDVPIVAANGQTVVPQGAVDHGTVVAMAPSTGPAHPAMIRLGFDRITVHGQDRPFAANIMETDVQLDDGGQGTRAVEGAVAGAAAGAALGMIIRGDLAGALTGAAIGAGAGTVISLGTARADASLPVGTRMTIQSAQHVQIH